MSAHLFVQLGSWMRVQEVKENKKEKINIHASQILNSNLLFFPVYLLSLLPFPFQHPFKVLQFFLRNTMTYALPDFFCCFLKFGLIFRLASIFGHILEDCFEKVIAKTLLSSTLENLNSKLMVKMSRNIFSHITHEYDDDRTLGPT